MSSLLKILKINTWEEFVNIVEPRMEDLGIIGNLEIKNLKVILQKV